MAKLYGKHEEASNILANSAQSGLTAGSVMRATYNGTTGNDVITGSIGDDSIFANAGDDAIDGGNGEDYIYADTGNDIVTGGGGDDHMGDDVYGQPYGNDTMSGDDGDDDMTSFGGNDILDGGAGFDRAILYMQTAVVDLYIDLAAFATSTGVVMEGRTIRNVEYGAFYTGSGNDTLIAVSGADNITAGAGNDLAQGSGDKNYFNGGDGNDSLYGAGGNDSLVGGTGDDTITGGTHIDTLRGGDGQDTLSGDTGDDQVMGDAGNDSLSGGSGDDSVTGGDGDDIVVGGDGKDTLDGGAGNDTASFANSGVAVTVDLSLTALQVTGGGFSDKLLGFENLTGSNYNDNLKGNTGANILDGGAGTDTLTGGQGDDTYYLDSLGDSIVELAGGGTDAVYIASTFSLAGTQIENLTLTGTGHLAGTGNGLANVLTGNSGNNLLDGDAGLDTVAGGLGNDTFVVNAAGDVVIEAAGQGSDLVRASASYVLSAEVERLELTGTASINGTGNGLNNGLTGNDGNNVLDGGAGVDTMTGGLGNDTYYIDVSGDNVVEVASGGTDTVYASASYSLAGRVVENVILTGTADLNATGNGVGNKLTGNAGNNILDGAIGNDTLTGGLGDDTYYVQSTGDKVVEANGEGFDTIYASVTYTLTGRYAEVLELTGTANLDATGNSVGNTLKGNAGDNVLNGLGGNDILTGNGGADVFLFQTGSRADTITDFTVADGDLINVNAYTGGVANTGAVTQAGANVVINLGSGNLITVLNAAQGDVLSHIVW